MTIPPPMAVTEVSQIGALRRAAVALAAGLGFDDVDRARVALVATEMGTNLVRHARHGGEVLVQTDAAMSVLELVALDRGPGIANVGRALRDGTSSAGTPGTGLGAMRRAATRFDLHSSEAGTAVYAALAARQGSASSRFEHGAVCVPYPGEAESGDAVAVAEAEGRLLAMVIDGLGHGPPAAAAARRAAEIFAAHASAEEPVALMQRLHAALRPTRGAAAAVAEVDARRGLVRFCGVGNVAATLLVGGMTRSLVSHHGTLGYDARRIAEFQYPWTADTTLILNSDGLISHWSLDRYPGLSGRAATLVAAVLYRDCRRHRDDASVLVVRETS